MNFSYYILDPSLNETYIKDLTDYSTVARKEGILGLENIQRSDFIGLGIELMADGHEPEWLDDLLQKTADNAIQQMTLILKATTLAFDSLHKTGENNAYKILINCFQPYAKGDELEHQARDLLRIMKNTSELKKSSNTQLPAILIKYIESLYELKELHQSEQEFCKTLRVLQHSLIENLKQSYAIIIQGFQGIQNGENSRVLEQKLKTIHLLPQPFNPPAPKRSMQTPTEHKIVDIDESQFNISPQALAIEIIAWWIKQLHGVEQSQNPTTDVEQSSPSLNLLESIDNAISQLPKPVAHILIVESMDLSPEYSCLILESSLSGEWQLFSTPSIRKEPTIEPTPHRLIDKITRYSLSTVAWVSSKENLSALKSGQTSWPEIRNKAIPIASNAYFLENWKSFYDRLMSTNPRRSLLSFNDLIYVSNRGLQALIRDIDPSTLIVALANADSKLINLFFGNMSRRAQELLEEDLALSFNIPEKDSIQAQKEIIKQANQFLASGDIILDQPPKKSNEPYDPGDPWQQALEETEDNNDGL